MRVIAAFFVNTLCNFAIGLLVAKFLGPAEFGRFALAIAAGAVLQTAMFDWIRLSAVRFCSERSRVEQPELRSTLDLVFALIAAAVSAIAVCLIVLGQTFSLSNALIGLAAALAIANGLFDYQTALVRARFHDQLYGRLVLSKNLLALVVTAGGAYIFGSSEIALVGVCISMAGSIILARDALHDRGTSPRLAHKQYALQCLRYSAPIVASNVIYSLIPLANRALMARWEGFSETGQFSLSFDLGTRVIAAIGTALDVMLFQIAVRAEETHGHLEGQAQVARNMACVYAIMLPTCAGVWLILPSIERLVVPIDYRGPFQHYFTLLIVGFFAFGMINFAINPVFQIAKRTAPMIAAACVAFIADGVIIAFLPRTASNLAIAQSGAMLAGLVAILVMAGVSGGKWPRFRDLAAASAGAASMIAALWPVRGWEPGVVTLCVTVIGGACIYATFVAVFNIAGLRTIAVEYLQAFKARYTA
jgi:O-antigen/teichoic acid export membrane protein